MINRAPEYLQPSVVCRFVLVGVLLMLSACADMRSASKPAPNDKNVRAQLNIGYSLLYQEADGIPKLKWLLMFKDKPEEVGRAVTELTIYYQQLADTLQRLSKQYPALRIDATTMSDIESDTRKAIGEDVAKDFAPLIGKSGSDFEREALLLFFDSLNEQRHLLGVMRGLEPDPGLRKFIETTKAQIDERHTKIEALLNRRYFTH